MSKSVVTFDANRQLGNFLFNVAAAVGYAKAHNIDVFWPAQASVYKDYFRPGKLVNLDNPLKTTVIPEKNLDYNPLPGPEPGSEPATYLLSGYFVAPAYFIEHARSEVLDLFIQPTPSNIIAIHVRRGDALEHPCYHDLSPGYYIEAWSKLIEMDANLETVIMSDDREWCERNLLPGIPRSRLTERSATAFQDFWTLAGAKYRILSGSTFSWWAAFLGSSGKTIRPDPWHRENRQLDIGLAEWEALSAHADYRTNPLIYLKYVISRTRGNVIECGVGEGSTPLIRNALAGTERQFLSVDSSAFYIAALKSKFPESDTHKYLGTHNWEATLAELAKKKENDNISVVFADQSPWMARIWTFIQFQSVAEYIVIADIDYYMKNGIMTDIKSHFRSFRIYPGTDNHGPILVGSCIRDLDF